MENKWKDINPELLAKTISYDSIEHIDFSPIQNQQMLNLVNDIQDKVNEAKYLLQDRYNQDIFNMPFLLIEPQCCLLIELLRSLSKEKKYNYIINIDNFINILKDKINNKEKENLLLANPLLLSDISKFLLIFSPRTSFKDDKLKVVSKISAMLMQIWYPFLDKAAIMNLFQYFKDNSKTYFNLLKQVQLDPSSKEKWDMWNCFFIKAMLWTGKKAMIKIKQISQLYHQIITNKKIKSNWLRSELVKLYFKNYELNRKILINKFKDLKSQKALYDDFDLVNKVLGALINKKGNFAFIKLGKILRD